MTDALLPPSALWEWAFAAPARLLAVDYDGTLAPFALEPGDTRPLSASVAALARIATAGGTRLAIVSGRPVAGLPRELVELPVQLVGEHGWERRTPSGEVARFPCSESAAAIVARAAKEAPPIVAPASVERKRTGVVVHTRALGRDAARSAEARMRELFSTRLEGESLELRRIAGGIELRLRGRDKGTALRELAAESGSGTAVVYLGDDDTDEDAFCAALALGGWGVLVGSVRPTAARTRLAGPAEVAHFLEEWSRRESAGGSGATGR